MKVCLVLGSVIITYLWALVKTRTSRLKRLNVCRTAETLEPSREGGDVSEDYVLLGILGVPFLFSFDKGKCFIYCMLAPVSTDG